MLEQALGILGMRVPRTKFEVYLALSQELFIQALHTLLPEFLSIQAAEAKINSLTYKVANTLDVIII